ncbi:hypothetical protein CSKR_110838 [Clonorchis sinensis]|uniref:Uncharacterized protein n=1 Tax=Clonorchis sinensis TaxID=79923 RepID=A0A419Q3S4_CLOSI|nr:hypothetical protein CSKR_110838 [Clonorchis sinensis]
MIPEIPTFKEFFNYFHLRQIKQRSAKIPITLRETEISLIDLNRLATLCFEIDTKEYGFMEILGRRRRPTNVSTVCSHYFSTLLGLKIQLPNAESASTECAAPGRHMFQLVRYSRCCNRFLSISNTLFTRLLKILRQPTTDIALRLQAFRQAQSLSLAQTLYSTWVHKFDGNSET